MITLQRYLHGINVTAFMNLMIEYNGSYVLANFYPGIPGHSDLVICLQLQKQITTFMNLSH